MQRLPDCEHYPGRARALAIALARAGRPPTGIRTERQALIDFERARKAFGWGCQSLGAMIRRTSSSFYLQAAQIILDDAGKAAAQITGATKAANDAIKTLKVINKVLSIRSAAGVVVASAMTGDLNQIASAVTDVYTAITG